MHGFLPSGPFARQGYHHGRLREALIAAARVLIAERGTDGFVLADAARLAGVGPTAPYRHFADKRALVAAVARAGFLLLRSRLAEAQAASSDPIAALAALGRAYLSFARAEPGSYAAMFGGGADLQDAACAPDAGAFGVLVEAIGAATGGSEAVRRRLATAIWALAHGLALLERSGQFAAARPGGSAEEILVEAIAVILRDREGRADAADRA